MRPRLVLIVGAARSGTTLLRLLLDAHPEIAAPGEAGIPAAMAHLASIYWTLGERVCDADERRPAVRRGLSTSTEPPSEHDDGVGAKAAVPRLSDRARAAVRDALALPMANYCARTSKVIYCDKSLNSVDHLDLVHDLVPEVRCILAFRQVMDTIASGLEACPWGFNGYGYLPFVQATPDNLVAALASYWLSHVERALAWESRHPDICHRIRYEDLVLEPESTLASLFRFLGVAPVMSMLQRAFSPERATDGPGDYKVVYTSGVHPRSIGLGKRVPVDLLSPAMLQALNLRLEALGYQKLDSGWNAEPNPTTWQRPDRSSERLSALIESLHLSPDRGHAGGPFAIVADDDDEARWVVEPESGTLTRGDGEVESVITGTARALAMLIAGDENAGVLLRSGRVRYLQASGQPVIGQPEAAVARLLGYLVSRSDGSALSLGI